MTAHARSSRPRRVRLAPERWVSIRPIDVLDRPALSDLHAAISPESLRRRFLGAHRPSLPELDRLARADGFVGVLRTPGPADGSIVAHAVLLPVEAGRVEAAFLVRDDLQGHGIGSALVAAAIDEARALGFDELAATTFVDNGPMRRLLLGAGCPVAVDRIDAGVEEIVLRLVSDASRGAGPAR